MDGGFLPLILVMGRLGFMSLDVVLLGVVMICMRIVNMGNMYIINK